MEKNLILFLILFIFLFNYQSEFFTDTSEESIYSDITLEEAKQRSKITIGSCWANTTFTSFDRINDKSPQWLIRLKEKRDLQINAQRCNRYKKIWKKNR